jgi:hypothetical protein
VLNFAAGGSQTVLAETNSTTWATFSETITASQNLDTVDLYITDEIGQVYYDFLMMHKGSFTLPNIAGGMNIDFPPSEAIIPIPGKDVDLTQHLGSHSAEVTLTSDLTQGTWKRTGDTIDGEVFLDIHHNRSGEPWQWLDTGSHQFKVTVHPKFRWVSRGAKTTRMLDLVMREYSLADKSGETYAERYGIG